jgi:hypothetical protein
MKSTTIADVAERADVSKSTVSAVINNRNVVQRLYARACEKRHSGAQLPTQRLGAARIQGACWHLKSDIGLVEVN